MPDDHYVVYCYDCKDQLVRDPYWSTEKAQEVSWFGRTFVLHAQHPNAILVYKEV
jgi:hypothetical protein